MRCQGSTDREVTQVTRRSISRRKYLTSQNLLCQMMRSCERAELIAAQIGAKVAKGEMTWG
jgi:hypothetical protein